LSSTPCLIGLDISMRATGVAVVDFDYELIESRVVSSKNDVDTDSEVDCIVRAKRQADEIVPLFLRYQPSILVIEGPAYNALVPVKSRTGIIMRLPAHTCQLWQLTGALKYSVMGAWSGKISIVSPTELKKHITGNGKADKEAMIRAIHDRFTLKFGDHNECDAYSLCVFQIDKMRKQNARKSSKAVKKGSS
jgi:Holliday junction resolvasome RuvABC endonuclease subunit